MQKVAPLCLHVLGNKLAPDSRMQHVIQITVKGMMLNAVRYYENEIYFLVQHVTVQVTAKEFELTTTQFGKEHSTSFAKWLNVGLRTSFDFEFRCRH